ncbi:MAG: hypothetical protein AAGG44_12935, partial [Planctomycetota bacterium]
VLGAGSLPANRMNAVLTTESPSSPQLFFSFEEEQTREPRSWEPQDCSAGALVDASAEQEFETKAELRRHPGSPSPTRNRVKHDPSRIAKPARIGTVMMKLLKSYGITDEEIQAGLEAYASKHQVGLAS